MSALRIPHLDALHHLLRYLKASSGQGLLFSASSSISLKAYADADWGSYLDTHRSTMGHCVFLGDSLISWKSKKQHTVSRSSIEVEHKALASVTNEVLWVKALLKDFNVCIGPTLVFCDNNAAIHLASNPSFHEWSKHIEINCHFTRDRVQDGTLHVVHVNLITNWLTCSQSLLQQLYSRISYAN